MAKRQLTNNEEGAKDSTLYQVAQQVADQTETTLEATNNEPQIDRITDPAINAQPNEEDNTQQETIERDIKLKKIVSNLPEEVKKKFVALKAISERREVLAKELEKKIVELERKFDSKCIPLDKLRSELINGEREPSSEELKDIANYTVRNTIQKPMNGINVQELKTHKGIPKFWSKALQNSPNIKDFIFDYDIPILDHLINIYKEQLEGNSFKLVFTFSPNDYFTNEELIKTIIINKNDIDDCKETDGTKINWKEGKNVTKKTIKKKKKVMKDVEVGSFFNYFKGKKVLSDREMERIEENEENMKMIDDFNDDLDITEEIDTELIPRAVYYYLGLVKDEDEFSESTMKGTKYVNNKLPPI